MSPTVEITTIGLGHAPAPATDLPLIDLRPYLDPHITPELRYMTARDQLVRETVRRTPGVAALLAEKTAEIAAHAAGPAAGQATVTVATACTGGRHRAPSFGLDLQAALQRRGLTVRIVHRDLDKDVIQR